MTTLQSTAVVAPSAGPVRSDDFRAIVGSFASGITVVTTLEEGGAPRGATVSAFASISLDPPVVMVSLDSRSGTLAAIHRHGAFGVNVLARDAMDVSRRLAASSSDFGGIAWQASAAARGVPVLADLVVAHAECIVHEIHQVGDHHLVFGLVVGGRTAETEPLVYHRRLYHCLEPIDDGRN